MACCDHGTFDGLDPRYQRILWIVIAINGVMFFVEMFAGVAADSQALQADALDFLGDTLTYGISLWAIGKSIQIRSRAALFKGYSLLLMALWVLGSSLWRVFFLAQPDAFTMGSVGLLACAANIASVLLLMRYRNGDANVRSVWLCSRNDAIGNLIIVAAAFGVWGTASGWPDVIVALIMAGLFSHSAWLILRQAQAEKNDSTHVNHESHVVKGDDKGCCG